MSNPSTDPHDHEETEHGHIPDTTTAIETIELYGRLHQLRRALADTRRAYANLVAACRAGLAAHADGETDPFIYIRDELPPPPVGHPLSRSWGGGGA